MDGGGTMRTIGSAYRVKGEFYGLYKRLSIQRLSEPMRLAIRGSLNAYRARKTGQGRSVAGLRGPIGRALI